MKQSILLSTCLSFSIITLTPEGRSTEIDYNKPAETNKPAERDKSEERKNIKKNNVTSKKDAPAQTTDSKKASYETHTSFENNLKDQYKALNDPTLTAKERTQRAQDAQQKARDEYEQRHNNGLTTGEFVADNINIDHATSVYGKDKDTSSKQLSTDLFNIDPHLFKEYNDKHYSIKPKLQKLTINDFQSFEKYPGRLIDTSHYVSGEYSGKKLRLTPLEESIELKDKDSVNKIIDLIKDPSFQEKAKNQGLDISIKSLTQPLIDKYIETLREKGIQAASEYVQSIESLGVPELTKSINRQTAMLYLQWSLADGDIETAKNILNHIRSLKIKTSFIADELTKRYEYLKKYKGEKEANSFAEKIEKLGDTKLNAEFNL